MLPKCQTLSLQQARVLALSDLKLLHIFLSSYQESLADGTRSNSPYSYPSSQYPVGGGSTDVSSATTIADAPTLPPLTRGGQVSLKIQLVSVLCFKKYCHCHLSIGEGSKKQFYLRQIHKYGRESQSFGEIDQPLFFMAHLTIIY